MMSCTANDVLLYLDTVLILCMAITWIYIRSQRPPSPPPHEIYTGITETLQSVKRNLDAGTESMLAESAKRTAQPRGQG